MSYAKQFEEDKSKFGTMDGGLNIYCINCGNIMKSLLTWNEGCHDTTVEWCEQCGSVVTYTDNDISIDNWEIPKKSI